MSTAPVITIFVRHSEGCKYEADEFAKRCDCRKHLRWFANGKLIRRPAKTRSWAEAEDVKRDIIDELSGKKVDESTKAKAIRDCIDVFIQDKKVQRVLELHKYTRELGRLKEYCEQEGVYTVQRVTRELLTGFMATWETKLHLSPVTQSKTRERLRSFLRYCYEAEWLARVPVLPTIKTDMIPTLPLVGDEYPRLLASIAVALPNHPAETQQRVHALFQLMRWSGLAIRDALTLPRMKLFLDKRTGEYRVVTQRTKTGVDVSVVIPTKVAEEILAVPNSNSGYIFWSGNGKPKSMLTTWQVRLIAPVFRAAGLYDGDAHMVSHRLRDTFAVEFLNAGGELEYLSKALGHRSIRTTERSYAQWVQGRQDRLDSQVRKAWSSTRGRIRRKKTNDVSP
jgi:site-specific recombinase XerD